MRISRQTGSTTGPTSEVHRAALWDDASGSDFFFEPDAAQITATGNAESLVDVGWTVTSLSYVAGVGADFLATADKGVPAHYLTNASGDKMQSPAIFGDYQHGDQASHHLLSFPTTLTMETWATFSVASASETTSGFGFVDAGGTIVTATDHIAVIHSDGTNFICRSNGDADTGALIDTALHKWTIVLSTGTTDAIEWFIDDVSQGTLDLLTDVFPASWGFHTLTTNRLLMGSTRIFYR